MPLARYKHINVTLNLGIDVTILRNRLGIVGVHQRHVLDALAKVLHRKKLAKRGQATGFTAALATNTGV